MTVVPRMQASNQGFSCISWFLFHCFFSIKYRSSCSILPIGYPKRNHKCCKITLDPLSFWNHKELVTKKLRKGREKGAWMHLNSHNMKPGWGTALMWMEFCLWYRLPPSGTGWHNWPPAPSPSHSSSLQVLAARALQIDSCLMFTIRITGDNIGQREVQTLSLPASHWWTLPWGLHKASRRHNESLVLGASDAGAIWARVGSASRSLWKYNQWTRKIVSTDKTQPDLP